MTLNKPVTQSGSYTFGKDLTVNRLGFGAMRITGPGIWGEPADHNTAIAVLKKAVELGTNFIDTADSYGPEVSEKLIAEALYPYPDDLLIATKGGLVRPGPNQWVENGNPAHLRQACEASLQRLKLDKIDLYQLHRIDSKVPLADQIGVLIDLKNEGKIRHIGLSEVSLNQLKEVEKMVTIASVQNKYNLSERNSEDVLTYCTKANIAFIPWFPLATGKLAQPGSVLEKMANKLGVLSTQIALAWLLKKSPVILPIPGTSSLQHLQENVNAALVKLDKDLMEELNGMG